MATTWLRGTQPQIHKFKYLVANSNISTGPKKVFCEKKTLSRNVFKYYYNRIAKEEMVGIIDIELKSSKSFQRRSIQSMTETELEAIDDYLYKQKRPARLLPLRMTL